MPAAAFKIARFALNVRDLGQAAAFYVNALGFDRLSASQGSAGTALLRLGDQQLELRAASGAPYPVPSAANDPWFQHFAIAVSDMPRAYRQLSRYAQQPITQGGPQHLPPSTGSVTAYKFRDPDGHPLELSYIPGSDWLKAPPAGRGPFLGIDHSAIAVRDLQASVRFYRDVLGLSDAGRFFNEGAEQDRLDELTHVRLDIAVLRTDRSGPHIELLHYRSPIPGAERRSVGPDDIAATRMILYTDKIEDVQVRLDEADVRCSVVTDTAEPKIAAQDPDGHRIEFWSGLDR
jgi:catechol 2,3-dioxygenase-like lactoylglutathione lyase family enzyme